MLKREIKYEDFNGDEVTDVFYFHISEPELIELEVEPDEGLGKMLERIVKTEDKRGLVREFKKIVLLAYGEKSPDGKRFVKSDEMRTEFSQHAAYHALFMELASNDNAAVTFIKGILPNNLRGDLDKALADQGDPSKKLTSLQLPPQPPSVNPV